MFSVTGAVAPVAALLELVVPAAAEPDVPVTLGLIDCFLPLPARRRGLSKR
jgi:hypothetical protein